MSWGAGGWGSGAAVAGDSDAPAGAFAAPAAGGDAFKDASVAFAADFAWTDGTVGVAFPGVAFAGADAGGDAFTGVALTATGVSVGVGLPLA